MGPTDLPLPPQTLVVGTIAGRHSVEAVESYIFHHRIEDPNDFVALERHIKEWLHEWVIDRGVDTLHLYITGGLSQITTSFLKMWTWACYYHPMGMPALWLMQWDNKQGKYLGQPWDLQ